ncbi:MAG: MBL fold metallo-hydrolase [Brevirhabdus sp.]
MKTFLKSAFLCLAIAAAPALAAAMDVQKVTDGVWALVGPLEQRNPENLGNNSTHGVIVTDEGVVLIDAGGSHAGAEAIDTLIAGLTDQPVKFVINTGGQDHRWMGNGYWHEKGATIIASAAAVEDQTERASMQLTMLDALIKDKLTGTDPEHADVVFDDSYAFSLGGVDFEITHAGAAHTPGNAFVWVPSKDTVFTGDMVYVERILGVMEFSNTLEWVDGFETMAALGAAHVVPGHGHATTLEQATKDTYDYLVNLRAQMTAFIDAGGDIIGAVDVDQSAFSYLAQFDMLAKRNAQTVFEQMEWE